jgi:hypothetical protein
MPCIDAAIDEHEHRYQGARRQLADGLRAPAIFSCEPCVDPALSLLRIAFSSVIFAAARRHISKS